VRPAPLGLPRLPVCHVAYAKYPGDPRVRKEVRTLDASGFALDVLCLRASGESTVEVQSGVRIRRLPLEARRGSRLRYAFQYALFFFLVAASLVAAQLRNRYRIVHVHSLPDFLVLAALPSRILGARLVLDLHESMPEIYRARFPGRNGSLAHILALVAQRVACAFATRVITVNSTIAAILESRGVPKARIMVVENSPDWTYQAASEPPLGSVPVGTYEITIFGGLNPERDIPSVLDVAHRLRDKFRIRWRIIGPGDPDYVRRLHDEVRARNLEGIVTIEGEVPAGAVAPLISNSTIGIVSYERNPLTEIATPNKAYEYAIAGKAMVVADLGALRALLGETVLYYQPGEPIALAWNVARLLENPSEREKLGEAARARIDAHRWEVMAGRLVDTYRQCLDGGGQPSPKGTQHIAPAPTSGRLSGGR